MAAFDVSVSGGCSALCSKTGLDPSKYCGHRGAAAAAEERGMENSVIKTQGGGAYHIWSISASQGKYWHIIQ